jgi:hypothetical protein
VSQDKEGGFGVAWNLWSNAFFGYVEEYSSDNVLPFCMKKKLFCNKRGLAWT